MHGTKRTKKDHTDAKRQRDAVKIKQYNALVHKAYSLRGKTSSSPSEPDADQAALKLTTEILSWNPEFYTIWNYRREILSRLISSTTTKTKDKSDVSTLLESDLRFLEDILQKSPKVYWIWNHRRWCLENNPEPNWTRELKLVSKMLELDARNFHGWHYRRYVIQNMEKIGAGDGGLVDQEFEYTTKKINANFSNFSAWHNRTKLMPSYLQSHFDLDTVKRLEFHRKELAYLLNALYTDPEDQSAWLYHRWLLSTIDEFVPGITSQDKITVFSQQLSAIQDLYALEPDSKWCSLSLLHVKQLLSALDPQEFPLDVDSLTSELLKLQKMDPLRINRYQHLIAAVKRHNQTVLEVL